MRKSAVVAFICSVILAATTFAQLPPMRVPADLGVNIHFTDARPGEMEELAAAGFKFVRMDFDWARREKVKGQYDFAPYDRLIDDLHNHGLRALLILDYGNPLYDNDMSPHSEEARQAFAKMTVAAMKHFKGRGVIWEMWNEPNGFWRPKPNVDDYVKLAVTVGKAVKVAEPDEIFVGPALAGMDWKFFEKCCQGGCLKYWDAVTVHPYRGQDPETVAPDYARLRKIIKKYAPKGKTIPLLSGEWGYSSAGMGVIKQAKFLARQFLVNQWQHIRLSIWYDWHDDGLDPKNIEHHFGTVYNPYHANERPVYKPKPAYLAARTLMHVLDKDAFQKRVDLPSKRDFCLEFTGPRGIQYAAWTRDAKGHRAILPIPSGTYSVVNYVGKTQPDLVSDEKGAPIELTDSPIYLSRK